MSIAAAWPSPARLIIGKAGAARTLGTTVTIEYNAVAEERLLEEERRRQLAEERRMEREREAQRKSGLRADAEAWHKAMNLRAYIAAVKAELDGGNPVSLHLAADDWLQWSLAVADEIDPLKRQG